MRKLEHEKSARRSDQDVHTMHILITSEVAQWWECALVEEEDLRVERGEWRVQTRVSWLLRRTGTGFDACVPRPTARVLGRMRRTGGRGRRGGGRVRYGGRRCSSERTANVCSSAELVNFQKSRESNKPY